MTRNDFYICLIVVGIAAMINPWLEIIVAVPYMWYLMGKPIK